MTRKLSLRIGMALLLPLLALLAAATPSRAQNEDEILAAMQRWSATYGTATSAADMVALYHPDAVFWGTGGQEPMVGPAEFAPYFQGQFDAYTARQVTFVDPVIRIIGPDVATSTGLYRFNVTTAAGQPVEALLRYSFAFVRGADGGWLIIQHHSSQLPQ